MNTGIIRVHAAVILSLLFTAAPGAAESPSEYPETTAVLQEIYRSEVAACRTYAAFAQSAREEDYMSVALLFRAVHQSESVHARNFRNLLTDLGAPPKDPPRSAIPVGTTQENLTSVLQEELSEIDTKYPEYIDRLRPEAHEAAIRDITYAWQAEKQHRELLGSMHSAVELFFGRIVDTLQGADTYFVCNRCGSTLFEPPADHCGICGSPADHYTEVSD